MIDFEVQAYVENKGPLRQKIQSDVEAYLARGGKITRIESKCSNDSEYENYYKRYRDKANEKKARTNGFFKVEK